jgi:hypothetical protein
MGAELHLFFQSSPDPELIKTRFVTEDGREFQAYPGKPKSIQQGSMAAYEWRSGVKSLMVIFLRYAAWGLRDRQGPQPVLKGRRPSIATTLADVIKDGTGAPYWFKQMFGVDESDSSHIAPAFEKRTTGAKGSLTTILIKPEILTPNNIGVYEENEYISDPEVLEKMASEIEASEEAWAQNIPLDSSPSSDSIKEGLGETRALLDHRYPEKCPPGLRLYLQSFDTFIEERRKGFQGRKYVFDALDGFLKDPQYESGYFVIQGDPGIGKSAVLAELIDREKLPLHHFNIAPAGRNSPQLFLRNICARLVAYYQMPYERFPEGFDQDGSFLSTLLSEVSACMKHGERLLIAVDALDEVMDDRKSSLANHLFLPDNLPNNVYFVLTTRNNTDVRLPAGKIKPLPLDYKDVRNTKDIEKYIISRMENNPSIEDWRKTQKPQLSKNDFVNLLVERSEGNFMYLRHVLPEIERSSTFELTIENLPQGLRNYYKRHWDKMRQHDPEEFDRLYQPVVCVLAAAYKPVPVYKIAQWTRLTEQLVRRVLNEWLEFLHYDIENESERWYRLYHVSFLEFLQDIVDPGLKHYHRMIFDAETGEF